MILFNIRCIIKISDCKDHLEMSPMNQSDLNGVAFGVGQAGCRYVT
jgi:hypothetical protein